MRKPTNRIQAQMTTNLVSTSATTSTGALVNATSALQINDGEVAIFEADIDSANYGDLTTTPTGKFVQLVQGTPKSNNINDVDVWGVEDPAIVKSGNIFPKRVRKMTSTNYNSGVLCTEVYTSPSAIVVNENYGLYVQLDGRRQEREFGQNTDTPSASLTTPAVLPTNGLDYVLQTLAFKLNQTSELVSGSKRFAVLGLKVAGGSGTTLASLVGGTTVDFHVQNGVTYNMQVTNPFIRSVAQQIAASTLTAASTIEVIDPTTAGDAAKIDALMIVGLDAKPGAYEDDVIQVRTEVTLNPKDAFESDGIVTSVYPKEAVNSGRAVNIQNRNRAQLNIHTKQLTPMGEYFSEGYSYIDPKKNYGSFIVEFYDTDETVDNEFVHEKKAVVLWEQTEPNTLSVDGVAVGTSAIGVFTPSETAPSVVSNFTTWVEANN